MNRSLVLAALPGSATAGALLAVMVLNALSPANGVQAELAAARPGAEVGAHDSSLAGTAAASRAALRLADAVLAPVRATAPLEPWDADAESLAAHAQRRIATLARARDAAVAAFGPGASDSTVFQPIFFPLADRMPALPSATQIAIYEAELLALASPEQGATRFASLMRDIETRAGAAAAHEYALRQSPAAQLLRASRFGLDEDEYRRCFDALSQFESPALEPQRYLAARRALRSILGASRFAALWSKRDPRYAELRRLAERHALSAERIDSAYIVLNDMQDALLEEAGASARGGTRLSELYASQKRRLADILGSDTADAVLRDLAVWASDTQR